jgi:hypothetical protein
LRRMFVGVRRAHGAGLGIRRWAAVRSALSVGWTSAMTAITCCSRSRRVTSRPCSRRHGALGLRRWRAMKNGVVAFWITLRKQRTRQQKRYRDGK